MTGTRSRVEDWLAANMLAAVTIAGALIYGITRISYVGFYGEFGLDPEDVGIGYAATLARALPGLLFWFAREARRIPSARQSRASARQF